MLHDNAAFLQKEGTRLGSDKLGSYGSSNLEDAMNLEGEGWNQRRKVMRKQQHTIETQQGY